MYSGKSGVYLGKEQRLNLSPHSLSQPGLSSGEQMQGSWTLWKVHDLNKWSELKSLLDI